MHDDQGNPQADYTINITLRLFFNSLSLLGSLFIIISYIKFKRLRKFAFKLIFYLSISDLIFSISTFLVVNDAEDVNEHFCAFQGFALYYSSLSTIFWTSCIAYSLQKVVTTGDRSIEKKEKLLCFIAFILPIPLAAIPLFTDHYGPSSFLTDTHNRWCGILRKGKYGSNDNGNEGVILDWVIRFIPILLCFCFNTYMYLRVKQFFAHLDFRTDLMDIIKTKIKYFPLIPIFCWSLEIVFRIIEMIYINGYPHIINHGYIVWLDYFDSILEKSHGLLNALLYGCTHYVKQEWKNYAKRRNSLEEENPGSETLNSENNSFRT